MKNKKRQLKIKKYLYSIYNFLFPFYNLSKRGFTLIELIIVIGIVLVIIGGVGNLFFSTLRQTSRVTLINEVKQNGDYALSTMDQMIRNAKNIPNISNVCNGSPSTSFQIENSDGYTTTFTCPSGSETRIASNSGYLTTTKVVVTNCSFTCNQETVGTPAIVKIAFTVQNLTPSPEVTLRPEEYISLNFETSVVVRNTGL